MTKFIQFGCWNNLNGKGCLTNVMSGIHKYLKSEHAEPNSQKTEFMVVTGDNYYPDKVVNNHSSKKIIYPSRLIDGFNKLFESTHVDETGNDMKIYITLGNHDLETNSKKQNLFIHSDKDGDEEYSAESNCEIIRNEYQITSTNPNVELSLFNYKILSDGTLMLMVDTSMYDPDAIAYLPCYNTFFNLSASISAIHNIHQLREYQLALIDGAIESYFQQYSTLVNLIIVGHHPIYAAAFKKDSYNLDQTQRTTKIQKLYTDISFTPVIKHIYTQLSTQIHQPTYYYLCADLHLYQHGRIHLESPDITIHQYVTGTGGTKLDDPLDQRNGYINNLGINYELIEEQSRCGFLVGSIDHDQNVTFEFIPVVSDKKKDKVKSGGKKNTRKITKKTKRRNKTHKIDW